MISRCSTVVAWFVCLMCFHQLAHAERVDIVLRGGTVVDGTGGEPRLADVSLKAGKIVAIGKLDDVDASRVIDCQGLILAPGFIDLHTHSDRSITVPEGRANVNFLTQGCTTIVTGNCGFGPVDAKEYFDKIDSAAPERT